MFYDPHKYDELEKMIGIAFRNKDLLNNAFIHKSFMNEYKVEKLESNERLEFLGDAVLELVVTDFLYRNYDNQEGELTNFRSALVRGKHLAVISEKLYLGQYLYLSKGEQKSGGDKKSYILANTCEALIGAIYLDQGYEVAHKFINKFILIYLDYILQKGLHIDAKSKFQEMAQATFNITPIYKLIKEEGPDHDKAFTMGVFINEDLITTGVGKSKQIAEQAAAQSALVMKGWDKKKK
ncbi:MAG: ribonuclease III, ribonuclease III [Candidatus Peregrinibacteria bacterium GW2011_GWF2_33_10]|nr:MAG: ribonuclease III, ribonuclease III [Candidatus Peregrinibacteria bacterium GW2011_GWF2_33_10]OGJ44138.1 MAG: ribonuclease III [Candidatus Peregrinibacteria bacterium RIFOXYA12_FULL_33_12]OGJ45115.1 MAG: ribonuclease III [Candidatus Peregrinibacteria bacterium RIFOXYA2_FULL_33_21]OGJ50784.1 MAG: ribonuclease III [Candidatus Peregrinibacteria bacterium RIFOXYB2_FULL_33_20]